MWAIGKRLGIPVDAIQENNPGVDPKRLRPGDIIKLPQWDQDPSVPTYFDPNTPRQWDSPFSMFPTDGAGSTNSWGAQPPLMPNAHPGQLATPFGPDAGLAGNRPMQGTMGNFAPGMPRQTAGQAAASGQGGGDGDREGGAPAAANPPEMWGPGWSKPYPVNPNPQYARGRGVGDTTGPVEQGATPSFSALLDKDFWGEFVQGALPTALMGMPAARQAPVGKYPPYAKQEAMSARSGTKPPEHPGSLRTAEGKAADAKDWNFYKRQGKDSKAVPFPRKTEPVREVFGEWSEIPGRHPAMTAIPQPQKMSPFDARAAGFQTGVAAVPTDAGDGSIAGTVIPFGPRPSGFGKLGPGGPREKLDRLIARRQGKSGDVLPQSRFEQAQVDKHVAQAKKEVQANRAARASEAQRTAKLQAEVDKMTPTQWMELSPEARRALKKQGIMPSAPKGDPKDISPEPRSAPLSQERLQEKIDKKRKERTLKDAKTPEDLATRLKELQDKMKDWDGPEFPVVAGPVAGTTLYGAQVEGWFAQDPMDQMDRNPHKRGDKGQLLEGGSQDPITEKGRVRGWDEYRKYRTDKQGT